MVGCKLLKVRVGTITTGAALDKRITAQVKESALFTICTADTKRFSEIASAPVQIEGKTPLSKTRRNQPVSIFLPSRWNLLMAVR